MNRKKVVKTLLDNGPAYNTFNLPANLAKKTFISC